MLANDSRYNFFFKNNRTIPPKLTIAMSAELPIITSRVLRSWPVK